MTTQHPILIDLLGRLNAAQIESQSERSAILEFEAGVCRAEADALSILDLIRINPLALSGITALQVEVDGANEWLLTTDIEFARQYLRDIQAKEVAVVDLVDVLEKQYGCVAVLATLG